MIEGAAFDLRPVAAQRRELARGEPAGVQYKRWRLSRGAERGGVVDAEQIAARRGAQPRRRRREHGLHLPGRHRDAKESWPAGTKCVDGGARRLVDRDVVRMPVETVLTERDDDVWPPRHDRGADVA